MELRIASLCVRQWEKSGEQIDPNERKAEHRSEVTEEVTG